MGAIGAEAGIAVAVIAVVVVVVVVGWNVIWSVAIKLVSMRCSKMKDGTYGITWGKVRQWR